MRAATEGIQVSGGMGYSTKYPVETLFSEPYARHARTPHPNV